MIFRAIYLFFSYRRGGWSAQMEIQLHRYIEKAVLECYYWNPGHQSQASICCAPLYLTLTTMHLTFSFSFFLLFPPDLTLNHSNCILLEAVCVRSLQSLPHTHTPVWDWPRENLMKIKEEEESWTFTSLQFSRRHHVLARRRAPAVVFRGRSWGSTVRRAGAHCTLLCEVNFMIPNSAPQKWCVKFLSQQSQQKPSRPAFMVLSVSKGRLNKFCLLLLLVPSVRLNSSFSTSVIGLAAVIFLFFPLHLFVFLKNQEFEHHNQVKFILSTLRVGGKSQRNM